MNYLVKKEKDDLHQKFVVDQKKGLDKDSLITFFICMGLGPFICHGDACKQRDAWQKKLDEEVRKPPQGAWQECKNRNMLKKGGVMLVNAWKEYKTTIGVDSRGSAKTIRHERFNRDPLDELKRICEHNGYDAITVYPGCDHAVLRKLDLGREENKPQPAEGYECTTYVYASPAKIASVKAAREKEMTEGFIKSTQADEDAAKYYLQAAEWNLQEAVKNYFKGPDETKVAEFLKVTQADRATACLYLEGAGNDLKAALKNFFNGVPPSAPIHQQKRQASPTPSMLSINININDQNTLRVDVPQ